MIRFTKLLYGSCDIHVIFFFLSYWPGFSENCLTTVVLAEIRHVEQDCGKTIATHVTRLVVVFQIIVAVDPVQVGNVHLCKIVAQNLQSVRMALNVLVKAKNIKAATKCVCVRARETERQSSRVTLSYRYTSIEVCSSVSYPLSEVRRSLML